MKIDYHLWRNRSEMTESEEFHHKAEFSYDFKDTLSAAAALDKLNAEPHEMPNGTIQYLVDGQFIKVAVSAKTITDLHKVLNSMWSSIESVFTEL